MKNFLCQFLVALTLILAGSQCANTESPKQEDSVIAIFNAVERQHDLIPCSPPPLDLPVPRNVGLKGTYWNKQVVTVSFQPGVSEFYKYYVKKHAVKWSQYANLDFSFVPSGGDIRVGTENSGSWSQIGTYARYVSPSKQTLNLGWADSTGRTCIHEFGHAIGLMHEQTLIPDDKWDKPVIYADLAAYPNYWNKATVDANMFSGFNAVTMDSTAFDGGSAYMSDDASVLLYDIKDSWMKNKKGYRGGPKISVKDGIFISRIYPGRGPTIPPDPGTGTGTFVFTLQQRKDLLTRADGVRNAATIVRAQSEAAKVAADSNYNYLKRALKL